MRLQRFINAGAVFADDLSSVRSLEKDWNATVNGNPQVVEDEGKHAIDFETSNTDYISTSGYIQPSLSRVSLKLVRKINFVIFVLYEKFLIILTTPSSSLPQPNSFFQLRCGDVLNNLPEVYKGKQDKGQFLCDNYLN